MVSNIQKPWTGKREVKGFSQGPASLAAGLSFYPRLPFWWENRKYQKDLLESFPENCLWSATLLYRAGFMECDQQICTGRPLLGLMIYCHYLEILNDIWTRDSIIHFVLCPAKYIASSNTVLNRLKKQKTKSFWASRVPGNVAEGCELKQMMS